MATNTVLSAVVYPERITWELTYAFEAVARPRPLMEATEVLKQYALSGCVGAIYGATNTIVGHPFDTVKTKMQAQVGFGGSSTESARAILRSHGLLGFFHGCIPPMWGSAVYRGAQFVTFDTAQKKLAAVPLLHSPILPGSEMEARTLVSAVTAATARTCATRHDSNHALGPCRPAASGPGAALTGCWSRRLSTPRCRGKLVRRGASPKSTAARGCSGREPAR